MTTTPHDVAQAISVLNAHARAFGFGKEAIYGYKKFAAMCDAIAGIAHPRPVGVMVTCHNCSGTGRFISFYDGPTNERCRTCSASGKVYLRFVETTVRGHVWHHPWASGGREIFSAALGEPEIFYDAGGRELQITWPDGRQERRPFESVGDWKPNTPGAKLDVETAAELFNRVEAWITALYGVIDPRLVWPRERARQAVGTYPLELGRVGDICHYCGGGACKINSGIWTRHLRWSWPTCEPCSADAERWKDKTLPVHVLGPHTRAWLARRMPEVIAA